MHDRYRHPRPVSLPTVFAAWMVMSATMQVPAQCDPVWAAGDPPASLVGTVRKMLPWDPDGPGPLASVLVCVGDSGGFLPIARVATFDGTRWTQLGELGPGTVRAAASFNDQLFAATDTQLLRWTGSAWVAVASIPDVRAMQVYAGELYVTGHFTSVAGVTASRIARWDGATWRSLTWPLGQGLDGPGFALTVFQNVLYVGGSFQQAGGLAVGNLAIWNGGQWVTTGVANGPVTALAPRVGTSLTSTFLFAGGSFTSLGVAAQCVARFSPSAGTWTAMGSGLVGSSCTALNVRSTGISSYELVAAIPDNFGTVVFRWDGVSWAGLGGLQGSAEVWCMSVFAGELVVGRDTIDGGVHRYTGGAWQPLLGQGIHGTVRTVLADGADTILGGSFATISGTVVNHIARGTPGNWTPLGTGVTGGSTFATEVRALLKLPNGDILVGGSFASAGGQPASNIARWNGSTWSPLGSGVSGPVLALGLLPNGDVIAGGVFQYAGGGLVNNVARWTGTTWVPLGAGFNNYVLCLLVHSDGGIVAGGGFTNNGMKVARWNGLNWFPLAGGSAADVTALAELPGGNVLAATFAGAGGSSRWNGSSWTSGGTLPPGGFEARALRVLGDGDVVGGGRYGVFRLHAGAWASVATGDVHGLDRGTDEVWRCGGAFDGIAGAAAARFAQRQLPCPATAVTFGAGCPGSGGGNTLAVTSPAWANTVFRATGTGLPPTCYALAIWGLTPVVPSLALDSVFGAALPGCHLHVTPDAIDTLFTTTGAVQSQILLPNTPPIVGLQLFHQLVPVVVDAQLVPLEISTTNALQLTIGVF